MTQLTVQGFTDNRAVSIRKLEKALSRGNLAGVRRLANFVGSRSVYPSSVFAACEEQRFEHYEQELNGRF